ncbi:acid phosphatase [Stylonychia lemnae]|uniref:Acid phosphatase n=1 Tax=Stylonychia lemnae TaxID=5949 RepID=A0A077ZP49_STYLE|nr:acid phosphatase [Stylonychia lemnae]|eukprot:CDW71688.1 acid phosphatase [Stylonychia lemnae]
MVIIIYYILLVILYLQENCSRAEQLGSLPQFELVFVMEYIRHGHRAPFKLLKGISENSGGVLPGELTEYGKKQLFLLGQKRRRIYIEEQKFLSSNFDPNELLLLSTDYSRTAESLENLLHGMYPIMESDLYEELDYNEHLFSAIKDTKYETILNQAIQDKCPSKPIIRITNEIDKIMNYKSSTVLREFLTKDKFDIFKVEQEIVDIFGSVYTDKKKELQQKYGVEIKNLRDFFDISDQIICEHSPVSPQNIFEYRMIVTYILANNFKSSHDHFKSLYQYRIMKPLIDVLVNAKTLQKARRPLILKYIVHGLHDINLAQILDFLDYFNQLGWQKIQPLDFASSIRFELLQNNKEDDQFKIRVIYDDQIIDLYQKGELVDFEVFLKKFSDKLRENEDDLLQLINEDGQQGIQKLD